MKSTFFIFLVIILLGTIGTVAAQDVEDADRWRLGFGLYGWYTDIGADLSSGGETEIEASDVVDNLKMGFLGVFEARRDKWSFLADVIYLNAGDDDDIAPGLRADVELTNWIVTPMAAYRLVQTDRFVLSALAGARYLYMKAEVDLDTRAPLPAVRRSASDSGSNWDGIVGVHGYVNLSENWYLPYHLDVGTGESDLTWQVDAGIGYRFGRFDIVAGYRYLDYEFDDDTIFKNLDVRGPYVGI